MACIPGYWACWAYSPLLGTISPRKHLTTGNGLRPKQGGKFPRSDCQLARAEGEAAAADNISSEHSQRPRAGWVGGRQIFLRAEHHAHSRRGMYSPEDNKKPPDRVAKGLLL